MLKRSIGFLWYVLLWLLTGISFFSCEPSQDPIFYVISQEAEPVDPRINGMPTNIVQVGETVYVASRFSRTIHQYNNGAWDTLPSQPGERILDLAATEKNLYALTGDPPNAELKKKTGDSWELVTNNSGYTNIQSIYGAKDRLFLGAMISSNEFAILGEEDNQLKLVKEKTKLLKGAAYDGTNYYLATAGDGIYMVQGDTPTGPVPRSEGLNIVGIIKVGSQIVAVSGNGKILYGTNENFEVNNVGVTFTGGLALWKKDGVDQLLLLGIQGSSTSHGYQELVLSNGELDSMSLHIPGANPDQSSTANLDKYNSTLRRYPVLALLQAPDGILFAATVKNGLWSYRDGWNAEE